MRTKTFKGRYRTTSETILTQAIDFLPDPTFTIDLKGRVHVWNRAMEAITQIKAEDIVGKGNYEYSIPFYGERRPILIDMVIQGNTDLEKKYNFIRREGDNIYAAETIGLLPKRYLLGKAGPIYGNDGLIIGSIESIQDITERKLGEKALKESEEIFRVLFNQSYHFIGLLSIDGTLIKANSTALAFAGIKESDVIGRLFWKTPWWSHSEEERAHLHNAVLETAQGNLIRFESTHLDAEGHSHIIDFSIKPVRNETDEVILLIPEGRDITERKNAEDRLRESEEQYKNIFENASEGIFQTTLAGSFLNVNSSLASMFGYSSPQEMIDSITDLGMQHYVNPQDRDFLLKTAAEHDKVEGFEVEIFRKDGTKFWASINLHTVRDAKGSLLYLEGTNIDITERKRYQLELMNTKKELEDMNAALRVMLRQRDEDKNNIEQSIISNIKSSVFPFLEHLKATSLTEDQMTYCSEVEYCLNDITSSLIKELSSANIGLSPTEIQIASLIKEGKSSKEIARIFNISVYTVTSHRYHIRRKLGFNRRDKNLRAYLLTLK